MKAQTLKKRLDSKYSGTHNSEAYKMVKALLNNEKRWGRTSVNLIRPCYTTGSGRWTKNSDHTWGVTKILDVIGVKYELGNDAPRGGLTGNYIKIITKITF